MPSLYKDQIIDHYRNPRNFKSLENFTHKATLANTSCGDELEVFLKVKKEKVADVGFQGSGCAISIAAMSILSEKLVGQKISKVNEKLLNALLEGLNISSDSPRIKCAVLGYEIVQKALK